MKTETIDNLLNLVYPLGPTRARELKTQPGSDVLYHAPRSLKVFGVPEAQRESFMGELAPPLGRDEAGLVTRYGADTALMQAVMLEDDPVGMLAWSKPGWQDAGAGHAAPWPGAPGGNAGEPATHLLYFIWRGARKNMMEAFNLAAGLLEHQWLHHVGTNLASADARLYEVGPSCFQGSAGPEELSTPVACFLTDFGSEDPWDEEYDDDDDDDDDGEEVEGEGEEGEEEEAAPPVLPQDGAAGLPIPEHLIPSFRETVGCLDFDGLSTLSYPYDAVLASALVVAASGGTTVDDVAQFVRRLSPALFGPFGIPVTAAPRHLGEDLQDVLGDQYIPFFLAMAEDWLRDHRAGLPGSLRPDTPGALKALFNLACILDDAGAPYE